MSEENKDTTLVSTKIPDIMKPLRASGLAQKRKQIEEKLKEINPNELPNRLGLIFDDSVSMSGQPLKDAKMAVQNFTNNCNKFDTSVALYRMNKSGCPLTIDYTSLNILVMSINEGELGRTPLYTKLKSLCDEVDITRGIIFSDGSPTDASYEEHVIKKVKEKKVPIDTIFIGMKDTPGYKKMEWIAEQTSGIFIHFEDSKSLSQNLKYLSPTLRPLLANAEIKEKIQKGESI